MILPLTCSAVAKKQFQDSANGRVLVDYTTLRESISTESKSLIFFFYFLQRDDDDLLARMYDGHCVCCST